MNKNNYFSTLSWLNKHFTKISNNWKAIILLTLIVATFGTGFAFGTKISSNKITTNDFTKSLQLKIYKSKGSRDQNKIEQNTFKLIDPIQAHLQFSSASTGTVIQYKLVDSTKKSFQEFEIPLNGNGERYLTISPKLLKLEAGTYQVLIYQNNNKLLAKSFVLE